MIIIKAAIGPEQISLGDWRKMHEPGGSRAGTPYFFGKNKLLLPVLDAISAHSGLLGPGMAKELSDFVVERSRRKAQKTALSVDSVYDARMRDINGLFKEFFDAKGLAQDPKVKEFMGRVGGDLRKSWDREFPDVTPAEAAPGKAPDTGHAEHDPLNYDALAEGLSRLGPPERTEDFEASSEPVAEKPPEAKADLAAPADVETPAAPAETTAPNGETDVVQHLIDPYADMTPDMDGLDAAAPAPPAPQAAPASQPEPPAPKKGGPLSEELENSGHEIE